MFVLESILDGTGAAVWITASTPGGSLWVFENVNGHDDHTLERISKVGSRYIVDLDSLEIGDLGKSLFETLELGTSGGSENLFWVCGL